MKNSDQTAAIQKWRQELQLEPELRKRVEKAIQDYRLYGKNVEPMYRADREAATAELREVYKVLFDLKWKEKGPEEIIKAEALEFQDRELMEAVKRLLDPSNRLNPEITRPDRRAAEIAIGSFEVNLLRESGDVAGFGPRDRAEQTKLREQLEEIYIRLAREQAGFTPDEAGQ